MQAYLQGFTSVQKLVTVYPTGVIIINKSVVAFVTTLKKSCPHVAKDLNLVCVVIAQFLVTTMKIAQLVTQLSSFKCICLNSFS